MGATWKAIRALSLPRKLLLGVALVFAIAGLTIGLLTTGGRTPRAPSATIASRTEGAPSAHVRGDLAIAASYLGTSRARPIVSNGNARTPDAVSKRTLSPSFTWRWLRRP